MEKIFFLQPKKKSLFVVDRPYTRAQAKSKKKSKETQQTVRSFFFVEWKLIIIFAVSICSTTSRSISLPSTHGKGNGQQDKKTTDVATAA